MIALVASLVVAVVVCKHKAIRAVIKILHTFVSSPFLVVGGEVRVLANHGLESSELESIFVKRFVGICVLDTTRANTIFKSSD